MRNVLRRTLIEFFLTGKTCTGGCTFNWITNPNVQIPRYLVPLYRFFPRRVITAQLIANSKQARSESCAVFLVAPFPGELSVLLIALLLLMVPTLRKNDSGEIKSDYLAVNAGTPLFWRI